MTNSQHPRFKGIIPPLVTPLRNEDELDSGALESLIRRLIEGQVTGLFVGGTTGEGPCLSYHLRGDLIEQTCSIVQGRLPVLVGISDSSLGESVLMSELAFDAGASAVVATAPFYLPLTNSEITTFLLRLADEVPLPLVLYNMPSCVKVPLASETIEACLDHPNIVAVKDSSGDLSYFRRLVELAEQRSDWTILMGPEHLLGEALQCGGHGGVCGGANVAPEVFVGWYNAIRDGRVDLATEWQRRAEVLGHIYRVSGRASSVIKSLKCALAMLGVCSEATTTPIGVCTDDERRQIAACLAELEIQPLAGHSTVRSQ